MFLIGKADMTHDRLLTHRETNGVVSDIFQRLASVNGRLWFEAQKRFLTGVSTDFYMLRIGHHGSSGLMLESFDRAGYVFQPQHGAVRRAAELSNPRLVSGRVECVRMFPVRAMGFKTGATRKQVRGIGVKNDCVSTSIEAACCLMMEKDQRSEIPYMRKLSLLDRAPTGIVWTFMEGDHERRGSLETQGGNVGNPHLVALVSEDAGLGVKGIVEADYLNDLLKRDRDRLAPEDTILFSLQLDDPEE
jgi:hypothetical protein